MSTRDLLATAGSLEALRQSIVRFYCGTEITLSRSPTPDVWTVLNGASQAEMRGVRVRRHRSRYRFEMVPMPQPNPQENGSDRRRP